MNIKFLFTSPLAVCIVALSASFVQADLINWQSSVDLYQGSTVETFVNNNGTLAVAYNATTDTTVGGNTFTTVNGVPFVPQNTGNALVGATGESITINGGTDNENAFGDGEFTSNGSIFHLLRGGTFNVNSVTLGGLQAGWTYEIQVFTHDQRGSRNSNFITGFSDGTNPGVAGTSDLSNQGGTGGTTGDSITGSFVATGANITFEVFGTNGGAGGNFNSGNSQSQINAIQLRLTAPPAVPEPGTMAVLGLGAIGLVTRRRR